MRQNGSMELTLWGVLRKRWNEYHLGVYEVPVWDSMKEAIKNPLLMQA